MRILISILLMLALVAQASDRISMTAELLANGQYRMVLSGLEAEIDRICAQGDCDLTFPTRWQATNYFFELLGKVTGNYIVPLPPPMPA